ncbi:transposase [Streptomyces sp. NPDC046237]|uniref:transposase n=1 Tax=Streptomyces sp. NPDC046237 TaxID=3154914 RepID=UPI0033F5163D
MKPGRRSRPGKETMFKTIKARRGIHRWVVERTIAWLHGFRRLRVRWERRDDIHEAFLGLATCLITHRHVQRLC